MISRNISFSRLNLRFSSSSLCSLELCTRYRASKDVREWDGEGGVDWITEELVLLATFAAGGWLEWDMNRLVRPNSVGFITGVTWTVKLEETLRGLPTLVSVAFLYNSTIFSLDIFASALGFGDLVKSMEGLTSGVRVLSTATFSFNCTEGISAFSFKASRSVTFGASTFFS